MCLSGKRTTRDELSCNIVLYTEASDTILYFLVHQNIQGTQRLKYIKTIYTKVKDRGEFFKLYVIKVIHLSIDDKVTGAHLVQSVLRRTVHIVEVKIVCE